jgi:hypothetical protein
MRQRILIVAIYLLSLNPKYYPERYCCRFVEKISNGEEWQLVISIQR